MCLESLYSLEKEQDLKGWELGDRGVKGRRREGYGKLEFLTPLSPLHSNCVAQFCDIILSTFLILSV